MNKREKKYANRRARLLRLIDEQANGNKAEFGRRYGYTRAQIGQYVSETYNEGRTPGEGVIEKLEDKIGLPPGWFDQTDEASLAWPFASISEDKIKSLPEAEREKLEEAFLMSAQLVGLDIKK